MILIDESYGCKVRLLGVGTVLLIFFLTENAPSLSRGLGSPMTLS